MHQYIEIYEKYKGMYQNIIWVTLITLECARNNQRVLLDEIKNNHANQLWRTQLKLFKRTSSQVNDSDTLIALLQMIQALSIINDKFKSRAELSCSEDEMVQLVNLLKSSLKKVLDIEINALLMHIIFDVAGMVMNTHSNNLLAGKASSTSLKGELTYSLDKNSPQNITRLLHAKKLRLDLFSRNKNKISIDNDIADHAAWVFNNIYSLPFNEIATAIKNDVHIARFIHGVQHVARTANYISILANLYRQFGDKEALALDDEDIKLLKIAILFHDAAREGDFSDSSEHESGILLYCYLINVLGVTRTKAKLLVEAMVNKDINPKTGYFCIDEISQNSITGVWKKNKNQNEEVKNIYQKLIHDADCLDIIRAADHFDAANLDFYKQYAFKNNEAFELMALLITEVRRLIDVQGDTKGRTNEKIKAEYEHENVYRKIIEDIENPHYKFIVMNQFSGKLQNLKDLKDLKINRLMTLSTFDPEKGMTEENLCAAVREGKVFLRGVTTPSAVTKKSMKGEVVESFVELEIRKIQRRKGIPTRTQKFDRLMKQGNPKRSVSMAGYGCGPFSSAGFIILNPNIDDVISISNTDADSGYGKKRISYESDTLLTKVVKQEQLADLHTRIKMGGTSTTIGGFSASHVEIEYNISQYSAIYFSKDPNLSNINIYSSPYPAHSFSPLLQAIYIQNEYKKLDKKHVILPLVEYSGLYSDVRIVPENEVTREKIKSMWVEMCSDYIKKALSSDDSSEIYTLSVEDIKILSMYKTKNNFLGMENKSADANYDEDFKKEIFDAITDRKQQLINEQIVIIKREISPLVRNSNQYNPAPASFFSDNIFYGLMNIPGFAEENSEAISREIRAFLSHYEVERAIYLSGDFLSDNEIILFKLPESEIINKNHLHLLSIKNKKAPVLILHGNEILIYGYKKYDEWSLTRLDANPFKALTDKFNKRNGIIIKKNQLSREMIEEIKLKNGHIFNHFFEDVFSKIANISDLTTACKTHYFSSKEMKSYALAKKLNLPSAYEIQNNINTIFSDGVDQFKLKLQRKVESGRYSGCSKIHLSQTALPDSLEADTLSILPKREGLAYVIIFKYENDIPVARDKYTLYLALDNQKVCFGNEERTISNEAILALSNYFNAHSIVFVCGKIELNAKTHQSFLKSTLMPALPRIYSQLKIPINTTLQVKYGSNPAIYLSNEQQSQVNAILSHINANDCIYDALIIDKVMAICHYTHDEDDCGWENLTELLNLAMAFNLDQCITGKDALINITDIFIRKVSDRIKNKLSLGILEMNLYLKYMDLLNKVALLSNSSKGELQQVLEASEPLCVNQALNSLEFINLLKLNTLSDEPINAQEMTLAFLKTHVSEKNIEADLHVRFTKLLSGYISFDNDEIFESLLKSLNFSSMGNLLQWTRVIREEPVSLKLTSHKLELLKKALGSLFSEQILQKYIFSWIKGGSAFAAAKYFIQQIEIQKLSDQDFELFPNIMLSFIYEALSRITFKDMLGGDERIIQALLQLNKKLPRCLPVDTIPVSSSLYHEDNYDAVLEGAELNLSKFDAVLDRYNIALVRNSETADKVWSWW